MHHLSSWPPPRVGTETLNLMLNILRRFQRQKWDTDDDGHSYTHIMYIVYIYIQVRVPQSSHCRTAPETVLLAFAGFLCPTVTVRVPRIFTAFPSNTRAFYCAPSNLNQESICRIGCLRRLAHGRYLKALIYNWAAKKLPRLQDKCPLQRSSSRSYTRDNNQMQLNENNKFVIAILFRL